MVTKFTPLHDRMLVRRVEEAATTRGGILIPDSAKDKPQEGEVISVGKGNDYGHPRADTIAALVAVPGLALYRTVENGRRSLPPEPTTNWRRPRRGSRSPLGVCAAKRS